MEGKPTCSCMSAFLIFVFQFVLSVEKGEICDKK